MNRLYFSASKASQKNKRHEGELELNKVSKKNPTFVVVWFLFCFKGKNCDLFVQ